MFGKPLESVLNLFLVILIEDIEGIQVNFKKKRGVPWAVAEHDDKQAERGCV